jgi:CRP-like cAMP-binding protein
MSVLLDQPHSATVRAIEPSVFAVVEDPEAFIRAHPDFARSVATLLARRLQGVTSYLADLKRQFAGEDSHLGMVDEVLDSLLHHPQ